VTFSHIASTAGDMDKIWHRDKPATFIVPVKNCFCLAELHF